MTKEEAILFSKKWLPSWTGNNPKKLASFYSKDAFYSDPGIPCGVKGKKDLLNYFQKLLAKNPNWVWTQIEAIPLEKGFLNKWLAKIPTATKIVECTGVCFVQFNAFGEIERNEVYFDRTLLDV